MSTRPTSRRIVRSLVSLAGALLVGAALANCSDDDTPAAPALVKFRATLVGGEENPPVTTTATGTSEFTLSRTNDTLFVNVSVTGLNNMRFGHFHTGARGTNGAVVAFLVDGPTVVGASNGRVGKQFITAANLSGTLLGQPLTALIDQMRAGNIYVNLHTDANAGGEVRGQVVLVP
ncbi:CHRD domain-containing protein [Gemmatimonas groenlandica]|uniref:CHRD domain-containing protein n=1 Tax=Gemmatimonas groenlandica TaxID=2732249 RepID=A0A6M4ISS0_9BACT|nr:CHRD domain-containing protein [Gemmatimonas groenlandica]QJR37235.1 CHRD domain-containing protein [Gemmatimonas groenlandica]